MWIELFGHKLEIIKTFECTDGRVRNSKKNTWWSYSGLKHAIQIVVPTDKLENFSENIETCIVMDLPIVAQSLYGNGKYKDIVMKILSTRKLSKSPNHTTFKLIVDSDGLKFIEPTHQEVRNRKMQDLLNTKDEEE
jgi:hypothetical protein